MVLGFIPKNPWKVPESTRGYCDSDPLPRVRDELAVFAAGVIGVAGLALMPLLGQSIVPALKERELLVHLDAAPGTSRGEMVRIATEMGRELRSTPGVRNVGAHFGRAVMGDQRVGINSGELWLSVDPDADYGPTVSRIREIVVRLSRARRRARARGRG